MSAGRKAEPHMLRQAAEGIGIVTVGTAAFALVAWLLGLLVSWVP